MAFDIQSVWRQVTPDLSAELVEFWTRHGAIPDAERAKARAQQAVCVARDASGALCGVATAVLRVIPRLRQPTWYYRQFFAPDARGQQQARPVFMEACRILEAANSEKHESIGVLLELENAQLAATAFTEAVEAGSRAVFIGYSPRGFQLRVVYFEGAKLFRPAPVRPRKVAPATA